MSKIFLPDSTPKERLMILQEQSAKIEETTYQQPLTPDELSARREDLADNCIKFNQYEDELKVIKDQFKDHMDPLKLNNKVLLTEIKTKQASVTGTLYHMANHDEGMMETYDHEGILISTRRLRPE